MITDGNMEIQENQTATFALVNLNEFWYYKILIVCCKVLNIYRIKNIKILGQKAQGSRRI